MFSTKLYWVSGPWSGKLALSARPRGGDWLEDEIADWRRQGVDTVCSLLTREEELDLDLALEATEAAKQGLEFVSYPIADREVPQSESELASMLEQLDDGLSTGKNILLHCRQGIGRTGLIAACLFLTRGIGPEDAVKRLVSARGITVPETLQQRQWIDHFASVLQPSR